MNPRPRACRPLPCENGGLDGGSGPAWPNPDEGRFDGSTSLVAARLAAGRSSGISQRRAAGSHGASASRLDVGGTVCRVHRAFRSPRVQSHQGALQGPSDPLRRASAILGIRPAPVRRDPYSSMDMSKGLITCRTEHYSALPARLRLAFCQARPRPHQRGDCSTRFAPLPIRPVARCRACIRDATTIATATGVAGGTGGIGTAAGSANVIAGEPSPRGWQT